VTGWTQLFVQKNKEFEMTSSLPRSKKYRIGKSPNPLSGSLINKMNKLDTPMLGCTLLGKYGSRYTG
jgi:hypothetical protein